MLKGIKNISSIILTMIFLLSSTGVVVGVNYCACGGELSFELFPQTNADQAENNCCGTDYKNNIFPAHQHSVCEIQMNCCKFKVDYLKEDFHALVTTFSPVFTDDARVYTALKSIDQDNDRDQLPYYFRDGDIQKLKRKKLLHHYIQPAYPDDIH